jgi:hypothetical protein
MKNSRFLMLAGLLLLIFLPGCEVIAGIFKAGFWTAIILIVLFIALIGYGIAKMRG